MIDHNPDAAVSRVPAVASDANLSVGRGRSRPRTTLPYNGMPPRVAGSATSENAAKNVERKRPTQKTRIYGYILAQGDAGATRPEIAEALGLSENTVRPRVCELYATWNTTYDVPEVKEAPNGATRNGCAILLAAPHYPKAREDRPALELTSEDAANEA